jgi:hypothetical protein
VTDLKKLREFAEYSVNTNSLEYNILPTTVLSLLDTIERYEKALGHIASGRFGCDECTDPSTLLADHHTCIAREALNPKEGV